MEGTTTRTTHTHTTFRTDCSAELLAYCEQRSIRPKLSDVGVALCNIATAPAGSLSLEKYTDAHYNGQYSQPATPQHKQHSGTTPAGQRRGIRAGTPACANVQACPLNEKR